MKFELSIRIRKKWVLSGFERDVVVDAWQPGLGISENGLGYLHSAISEKRKYPAGWGCVDKDVP